MIRSTRDWAEEQGFKVWRETEHMTEYVATRKTPKKLFNGIWAFAIHDCVFYESQKVANRKKIQRHEHTHVAQSYRLGSWVFNCLYWIENFLHGPENNRFELEAEKAEKTKDPIIIEKPLGVIADVLLNYGLKRSRKEKSC